MSDFLIKRGRRAARGVAHAHIARYNAWGDVVGTWCGFSGWNLRSNVPWGLHTCRHCLRRANRGY